MCLEVAQMSQVGLRCTWCRCYRYSRREFIAKPRIDSATIVFLSCCASLQPTAWVISGTDEEKKNNQYNGGDKKVDNDNAKKCNVGNVGVMNNSQRANSTHFCFLFRIKYGITIINFVLV